METLESLRDLHSTYIDTVLNNDNSAVNMNTERSVIPVIEALLSANPIPTDLLSTFLSNTNTCGRLKMEQVSKIYQHYSNENWSKLLENSEIDTLVSKLLCVCNEEHYYDLVPLWESNLNREISRFPRFIDSMFKRISKSPYFDRLLDIGLDSKNKHFIIGAALKYKKRYDLLEQHPCHTKVLLEYCCNGEDTYEVFRYIFDKINVTQELLDQVIEKLFKFDFWNPVAEDLHLILEFLIRDPRTTLPDPIKIFSKDSFCLNKIDSPQILKLYLSLDDHRELTNEKLLELWNKVCEFNSSEAKNFKFILFSNIKVQQLEELLFPGITKTLQRFYFEDEEFILLWLESDNFSKYIEVTNNEELERLLYFKNPEIITHVLRDPRLRDIPREYPFGNQFRKGNLEAVKLLIPEISSVIDCACRNLGFLIEDGELNSSVDEVVNYVLRLPGIFDDFLSSEYFNEYMPKICNKGLISTMKVLVDNLDKLDFNHTKVIIALMMNFPETIESSNLVIQRLDKIIETYHICEFPYDMELFQDWLIQSLDILSDEEIIATINDGSVCALTDGYSMIQIMLSSTISNFTSIEDIKNYFDSPRAKKILTNAAAKIMKEAIDESGGDVQKMYMLMWVKKLQVLEKIKA